MNRATIRQLSLLVGLLLILCAKTDHAWATDFTWTGAGGVFRLFGDAGHWKPAGGPPNDTNDVAIFDGTQMGSSTFNVNFAGNVVNDRLVMTANSGIVTFDLGSRTYTLDSSDPNSLVVGNGANDRANLVLTSSTDLGTVRAVDVSVGAGDGSGALTVGNKARLLLSQRIFVGFGGPASRSNNLNIIDGGNVECQIGFVGWIDAGMATATVRGEGSRWHMDQVLEVGFGGNGTLIVEDKGRVESAGGRIGFDFSGTRTGTATVTGPSSIWLNSAALEVGRDTVGTLTISNGARVQNTSATIGFTDPGAFGGPGNGTVNVTGAGSTWDNSTFLRVGESGTGTLTIAQGGAVENTNAQIGSNAGSRGTVTLSGLGSTWTSSDSVYVGGSNLTSGGSGSLTVGGGSAVNIGTSSTELLKVWETGEINLNGGTINTQDFDVAGVFNWSSGRLSIADDLWLRSGATGTGLTIGPGKTLSANGTTSIEPGVVLRLDGGTLSVRGLLNNGSLLLNSGTFNLASGLTLGPGSAFGSQLSIGPGLSFNVTTPPATIEAGAVLAMRGGSFSSSSPLTNNGEIQLTDEFTSLSGGDLMNNAVVLGKGRINKSLVNAATGVVRATGDQRLVFGGASNANSGRLELVGGTMEFISAVSNAATGLISGRGALFFNGGLTNQGKMQFSGGPTDIYGNVNFTGGTGGGELINSGGANVVTFYGNVTHNGDEIRTSPTNTTVFFGDVTGAGPFTGTGAVRFEGSFAPGNSPAAVEIEGDVQLGADARLQLELGGTKPAVQYDQLHIGGVLSLDGSLDVSLLDGFVPSYGATFDLLDFGSLAGRFDTIALPPLDGELSWDTASLYTTGTITAVPEPQSAILGFVALLFVYAARLMRRLRTACAMSTRLQSRSRP